MNGKRLAIGIVGGALLFFAGVGIGGAAVGPSDTALPPTPTKTISVPGPTATVTVTQTPKPVISVKAQTPQACRDALTGADRVIDLSRQYVDDSQKAVQAVIDNNPTALDKVTGDITRIGSEVNRLRPNYLADSAACRGAK